jgi:hypothetical protein
MKIKILFRELIFILRIFFFNDILEYLKSFLIFGKNFFFFLNLFFVIP